MSTPAQPLDADRWIDAVPGPAALLDPVSHAVRPNAALRRLWPADHPIDMAAMAAAFAADGGSLDTLLVRGAAFGGRLTWTVAGDGSGPHRWHADFEPVQGPSPWLMAVVDLSAAAAATRQSVAAHEDVRQKLNRLNEYVALYDNDEVMLLANAKYASFFGLTPEQAEGRLLADIMGPNYPTTAAYRERVRKTLAPVSYERLFVDHEQRLHANNTQLLPFFDSQGRLTRIAAVGSAVTPRHDGMVALRQTLERLDALFEAGIEGILLLDQGRIADANPVACRHIGVTRDEVVGMTVSELWARLDVPDPGIWSDDGGWVTSGLSRLPDATGRPPLLLQYFDFSDDGRIGHALLLQDLSYRYRAQRRIDHLLADLRWQTLRAAAADRNKSAFLATASHDLRQPIHALGLFLTALRARTGAPRPHDPAFGETVAHMRASLDNLTALLDRLLGTAIAQAGAPAASRAPWALQPLIDAAVSARAGQAQALGLRLRAVPTRLWVQTDAIALHTALTHLIDGALRRTPRGRVVVGVRARGGQVELQVRDTGDGLSRPRIDGFMGAMHRVDGGQPPDDGAHALADVALLRDACEQAGARLEVRSTPGHGSMFGLVLTRAEPPMAPTPAATTDTDRDVPPTALHACNFLVIDDDPAVIDATSRWLRDAGHEVLGAAHVGEALRLRARIDRPFDAVLCDQDVADTVPALQVVRQRPDRVQALPLALLAQDASDERRARAVRMSAPLLGRPPSPRDLETFLALVARDRASKPVQPRGD